MTTTVSIKFQPLDFKEFLQHEGVIVLFANENGELFPFANKINEACSGIVLRAVQSASFGKMKLGEAINIMFPVNINASQLIIVKLNATSPDSVVRKVGTVIFSFAKRTATMILCQGLDRPSELALGAQLRAYRFDQYRNIEADEANECAYILCTNDSVQAEECYRSNRAIAEGVNFARDLVNEPANVLTTEEFASRILTLQNDGVEVQLLHEKELEKIGMKALLAVGQGSQSPSIVGVMKWQCSEELPIVLVGKGVVFDTGGISLKPALRMEQMTMDMAGAATVVGVMKSVAQRQLKANVIGIVGLVENMPDGNAQRPGDVVRSLKGDTIEVINTDAEGRLVLADLLWYVQREFDPASIIDLATLTGAIIVSLGNEFAGAFSNNDEFYSELQTASEIVDERVWRMPLDKKYDKKLKSRVADIKNVGDRYAGAITAAQFLKRFIKPEMPWIHLDIAGVASSDSVSDLAPPGGTGWGVRMLNQLIESKFTAK